MDRKQDENKNEKENENKDKDNPMIADSKGCKKLCPNCKTELDYFVYTCPKCGFKI